MLYSTLWELVNFLMSTSHLNTLKLLLVISFSFSCTWKLSNSLIIYIAKCIDHYTKLQVDNFQAKDASEIKSVDSRLEDIVNRMFQKCFEEKKFKQVIGIAIETRRLDIVEKAILTAVSIEHTVVELKPKFGKITLFLVNFGRNKNKNFT